MPVIDLADDLGTALRYTLGGQPPEFLKEASWRAPGTGKDSDYALILIDDDDSEHRKYACHDAGNTAVSMFYLERFRDNLNPAAQKTAASVLAETARVQGVVVPATIEKMAAMEIQDEHNIVDERRVRFTPPRPPPKVASVPRGGFAKLAHVERDWPRLSPAEKRAAALQLSEEDYLSLPPDIFRYSGTQVSEKFASHMKTRAMFSKSAEASEQYKRLIKVAHNLTEDELVRTVYSLDNVGGFRWSGGDAYGEKIADPFLAVYDRIKEAEYSWLSGGDSISEQQLLLFAYAERAEDTFKNTFTDKLWEVFRRDPVGVFKGMPDEQKVLVSRMARQLTA